MDIKGAVKRRLPAGTRERTITFGVGRGIRLGLDLRGGDIQMLLGLYEVELSSHLRRVCVPGARSFDLGGSIGYDALVLARLTKGPVVSVECDATAAAAMRANVARNPSLGPIVVVEAAVASTSGAGTVTIDELAAAHFVPDVIKMDIEGAEADALRGGSSLLSTRGPAIVLEVHGERAEWECLELLRAAGYAPPTVIDPRRWLREHRPLAHNRWLVFASRS